MAIGCYRGSTTRCSSFRAAMTFDVPPGSRRSPNGWPSLATVRLVVRLADEPSYPISELTGHPGDQGTNWRLIAPESNGSTDLIVGVFRLDPGQTHPRHLHPAGAEFYYILEGECTIGVGDDLVTGAPGTAFH